MQFDHPKKVCRHLLLQSMVPILAVGFSISAQAEEPAPEYTLSYNAGAVTDYRVRGITQTARKPAAQAGVDFAHKSGIYLGTFVSNVNWVKDFNGASKGSYELDLYGGFKGALNKDISYDIGVINYRYPGNNSGSSGTLGAGLFSKADTVEVYGALTYSLFTFKYNRSVGDFLGNLDSSGSQYVDLSAAFDLTEGFTLTPHVGRQLVRNGATPLNYTDVALTLSKDFGGGLTGSIAAMGNNANKSAYTDFNGKILSNSTVLVGVKYTF
jgi:uncharacterized protein (TIGR02001 family)